MYISYKWLQDFIKLPKSYSPEKLANDLTLHTVEVEGVYNLVEKYNLIVAGEVLEVKKHPQADKLNLALVNIGEKEPLKIVCGASNLREKQKVVVAKIGSKLPNGLEILQATIRGEVSQGMICAEDELGLGLDHEGIMVLDSKAKAGLSLAKYLNLDDTTIEIDNKSLSNRPDLWGHYGIARELSVILGSNLLPYEKVLSSLASKKNTETNNVLDINIESSDLCPYYSAIKIKNLKIKESSALIKQRLLAAGINPINNIVDITNYLMLDLGQPLHAFDASLVKNIVVKKLKQTEKFLALNGKEYDLLKEDLVIADNKETLAVAGIIGTAKSGVSDQTSEIIIESANFNSVSVRKTSQRLGLRTEASSRFEKSLDPALAKLALRRAIDLIRQDNPEMKLEGGILEIGKDNLSDIHIELDLNWLEKRIGQKIKEEEVLKTLTGLGFIIEAKEENLLKIKVPSWRATKDISIPEDILEEVVRLHGFDKIKLNLPYNKISIPIFSPDHLIERNLKDSLTKDVGFTEVNTHVFVNSKQLNNLGINHSHYLSVKNPLNENLSLLRQSLVPNILEVIKYNQARYQKIKLFELASVYLSFAGKHNTDNRQQKYLPHQEKRLILALASKDSDLEIFSEFKGYLESLFLRLFCFKPEINYEELETSFSWAQASLSANFIVEGKMLSTICKLKEESAKQLGIKKSVLLSEINYTALFEMLRALPAKKYKSPAKFPALIRDLAFIINNDISYRDIKMELENFHHYIYNVELFDVYQGEELGNNKKSLAFHLVYKDLEKTLTTEEVNLIQTQLINHLENKYQAQIRNF